MNALKHSLFAGLLASLVLASGCSSEADELSLENEPEQGELQVSADGKADAIATTSTYWSVRRDFRRCAWPYCGGFWVKQVNRTALLRCPDGSREIECYVTDIDYSALGLTDREIADHSIAEAVSIYRGDYEARHESGLDYSVLVVSEAWQPATDAAPTGAFFRVDDNQIRCITTPCPVSYHEAKLNSTVNTNVVGFEGIHADKIVSALGQEGHVLAAGINRNTRAGKKLKPSQFYLRVKHNAVVDDTSCSDDSDCTTSSYTHYIFSASECYCTTCPTTVVNNDGADRLRASWEASCSGVGLLCPLPLCVQPLPVACVSGQCASVSTPTN